MLRHGLPQRPQLAMPSGYICILWIPTHIPCQYVCTVCVLWCALSISYSYNVLTQKKRWWSRKRRSRGTRCRGRLRKKSFCCWLRPASIGYSTQRLSGLLSLKLRLILMSTHTYVWVFVCVCVWCVYCLSLSAALTKLLHVMLSLWMLPYPCPSCSPYAHSPTAMSVLDHRNSSPDIVCLLLWSPHVLPLRPLSTTGYVWYVYI